MTFSQLVKALRTATTLWDLQRIGVRAIYEGLADLERRLSDLEKRSK